MQRVGRDLPDGRTALGWHGTCLWAGLMMSDRIPVSLEPRVERLAIVEKGAQQDRIPLLVSSNQRLLAQGMDESIQEFSRRFVNRVACLPAAQRGLLLLNEEADFDTRWSNLLALGSRLQGADEPELIISVRSGSPSEEVGWALLDRASNEAFFRRIRLRLQFVTPELAPAAPSSEVRTARPRPLQSRPMSA